MPGTRWRGRPRRPRRPESAGWTAHLQVLRGHLVPGFSGVTEPLQPLRRPARSPGLTSLTSPCQSLSVRSPSMSPPACAGRLHRRLPSPPPAPAAAATPASVAGRGLGTTEPPRRRRRRPRGCLHVSLRGGRGGGAGPQPLPCYSPGPASAAAPRGPQVTSPVS